VTATTTEQPAQSVKSPSAKNEEYADRFARALLMPEKEFVARVFAGYGVIHLAALFGVTPTRVFERLDELGLREYVGLPAAAYESRQPTSWWCKWRWIRAHRCSWSGVNK
jgi:predicted transcriptional regulator